MGLIYLLFSAHVFISDFEHRKTLYAISKILKLLRGLRGTTPLNSLIAKNITLFITPYFKRYYYLVLLDHYFFNFFIVMIFKRLKYVLNYLKLVNSKLHRKTLILFQYSRNGSL